MSIRYTLARGVAALVFRRACAEFDVAPSAQIRTFTMFPRRGGRFHLGEKSIFAGRLAMEREGAQIRVGERSFVGRSVLAAAQKIDIGADVLISWGVTIVDHQSHSLDFSQRAGDVEGWLTGAKDWTHVSVSPVIICDKVWIGFGASILPGVTVGEGAVVGAGSMVTRTVEPWTVVAGNPARVIRTLVPGTLRSTADN
jgi:acetyltransferase-like isoleucine patch superfamily enzyme